MTRMMVMTFWGKERFHDALPDGDHPQMRRTPKKTLLRTATRTMTKRITIDALADHGHDVTEHDAAHDDHDDDDEHHHELPADFKPHESPWTMTVPLIVLAVLSTFGGLVGVPYAISSLVGAGDINVFEHTLEPSLRKSEQTRTAKIRRRKKSNISSPKNRRRRRKKILQASAFAGRDSKRTSARTVFRGFGGHRHRHRLVYFQTQSAQTNAEDSRRQMASGRILQRLYR